MFSPDYYEKLDPYYRHVLQKFEGDFAAAEQIEQRLNLIKEFSCYYMAPKELWNIYFDLTSSLPSDQRCANMVKIAAYQFYYKKPAAFRQQFGPISLTKKKLLKWVSLPISGLQLRSDLNKDTSSLLQDMRYPHDNLDKKWIAYEKCLSSMPDQKIIQNYRKMKALYSKIMEAENNTEEWYNALLESNNLQFIVDNIEYRLGGNLTDKKLWHLYLDYGKKHFDAKRLLHFYSRYCRFFLDDKEMKAKYVEATKNLNHVIKVIWKNVFACEHFKENANISLPFDQEPIILEDRSHNDQEAPAYLCYDKNNLVRQNFPFETPQMLYILQNANAQVLQSLYKSCKWFFAKLPYPICYQLIAKRSPNFSPDESRIIFFQQSVQVYDTPLAETKLKNVLLSTVLDIASMHARNMLSIFIPFIYQSELKYIKLSMLDLTFDELKFLIGHGNVVDLDFTEVRITDVNGEDVLLEEVLAIVPKAQFISVNGIKTTQNTSKALCKIEFLNKIESLRLVVFDLEPVAFGEFLKKNMAPKSNIFVHYVFSNNQNVIENFRQIVTEAVNSHWETDERPALKAI